MNELILTSTTLKALRIIPFPISSHRSVVKAAVAARTAHAQGKFWGFHRTLFEKQDSLNYATIQAIARQLALDMTKFNQNLRSRISRPWSIAI